MEAKEGSRTAETKSRPGPEEEEQKSSCCRQFQISEKVFQMTHKSVDQIHQALDALLFLAPAGVPADKKGESEGTPEGTERVPNGTKEELRKAVKVKKAANDGKEKEEERETPLLVRLVREERERRDPTLIAFSHPLALSPTSSISHHSSSSFALEPLRIFSIDSQRQLEAIWRDFSHHFHYHDEEPGKLAMKCSCPCALGVRAVYRLACRNERGRIALLSQHGLVRTLLQCLFLHLHFFIDAQGREDGVHPSDLGAEKTLYHLQIQSRNSSAAGGGKEGEAAERFLGEEREGRPLSSSRSAAPALGQRTMGTEGGENNDVVEMLLGSVADSKHSKRPSTSPDPRMDAEGSFLPALKGSKSSRSGNEAVVSASQDVSAEKPFTSHGSSSVLQHSLKNAKGGETTSNDTLSVPQRAHDESVIIATLETLLFLIRPGECSLDRSRKQRSSNRSKGSSSAFLGGLEDEMLLILLKCVDLLSTLYQRELRYCLGMSLGTREDSRELSPRPLGRSGSISSALSLPISFSPVTQEQKRKSVGSLLPAILSPSKVFDTTATTGSQQDASSPLSPEATSSSRPKFARLAVPLIQTNSTVATDLPLALSLSPDRQENSRTKMRIMDERVTSLDKEGNITEGSTRALITPKATQKTCRLLRRLCRDMRSGLVDESRQQLFRAHGAIPSLLRLMEVYHERPQVLVEAVQAVSDLLVPISSSAQSPGGGSGSKSGSKHSPTSHHTANSHWDFPEKSILLGNSGTAGTSLNTPRSPRSPGATNASSANSSFMKALRQLLSLSESLLRPEKPPTLPPLSVPLTGAALPTSGRRGGAEPVIGTSGGGLGLNTGRSMGETGSQGGATAMRTPRDGHTIVSSIEKGKRELLPSEVISTHKLDPLARRRLNEYVEASSQCLRCLSRLMHDNEFRSLSYRQQWPENLSSILRHGHTFLSFDALASSLLALRCMVKVFYTGASAAPFSQYEIPETMVAIIKVSTSPYIITICFLILQLLFRGADLIAVTTKGEIAKSTVASITAHAKNGYLVQQGCLLLEKFCAQRNSKPICLRAGAPRMLNILLALYLPPPPAVAKGGDKTFTNQQSQVTLLSRSSSVASILSNHNKRRDVEEADGEKNIDDDDGSPRPIARDRQEVPEGEKNLSSGGSLPFPSKEGREGEEEESAIKTALISSDVQTGSTTGGIKPNNKEPTKKFFPGMDGGYVTVKRLQKALQG